MERKRELTSVDLAAIVGELQTICGAKVNKAYRYDDDLFRLRLRHYDHGRLELFIQVGELKRVHLTDPALVPDAPERPPNFARMLRNQIAGAELVAVEQYEFDRIVRLQFERGGERTELIAELFGDGNLVVVDGARSIVDAVRTVRLRSRTVAPGSTYEFPDAQANPFAMDLDECQFRLAESDADLVRSLATQLNLGGTFAEEVCARAGMDGSRSTESLADSEIDEIYGVLQRLYDRIRNANFDPKVYYRDGHRIDVVPFALAQYEGFDFEEFSRFTDALDDYFRHYDEATKTDDDDGSTIDEEIARQQRIIEQQEGAIEQFDREAERIRQQAESLYASYEFVDDILTTIKEARRDGRSWAEIESTLETAASEGNDRAAAVNEIDPENRAVTVAIDGESPELIIDQSVEQNASRLYEEAKAVESKKAGAIEALEATRAKLNQLRSRDTAGEPQHAAGEESEGTPDWTEMPSVPVRQTEQWFERFRWFRTSDGYLVIGGRNADQNEELVSKYLEPHDRFAHAQAHGGPVSILKAAEPSERSTPVDFSAETLDELAQFAVSYSSVWKAGQFAGDAYHVAPDQVSKTPESGETLDKGAFVIRGDREYYHNVPVGLAIGITCEPETRVIGGPTRPIETQSAVSIRIEPGRYAQADVAKRIYREFRESFTDTTFVRKVASPDKIQEFLPPGTSSMVNVD